MKKRILSLILALSMVLSVLPLGAFAEGSNGDLVIGSDGYPVGSNGGKDFCSGNNWEYSNYKGTLHLSAGTFDLSTTEPVKCKIQSRAKITGGTFNEAVKIIAATITKGIFSGTVYNSDGKISGGTFQSTGSVTNWGDITGGTFAGSVENKRDIYGGVFNRNATLTDVPDGYSITWDKAYSGAEITEVNGVPAEWAPYVVVTDEAKTKVVTITADTDIYSLNGKPIGTDYNSSYPDTSKKTIVTFTMPNEKVVLGTGELVMAGGYPIGSNGGTANCEGKGWTYSEKDASNPKGKLTLTSGTFDFSSTYPQNTSKGAGAEPVACAVETQLRVEITGGTFEGKVINNDLGEISGGTFHEKVSNYNGMIIGGTFKSSVTSTGNGRIFGGVFNSKTTQKPATDAYSITLDAAYPNAKITEVNGVPAEWEPYVVVTQWTKSQEVTITADTEIYSLNGKSIGDGNCNSSYGVDKKTVKFTMPSGNVVLNGAITCTDLVMEKGWPKASNEGKISCSGTGWEYIKKSSGSTNTGTLYLMSGSEPFDFNFADPTTKITRTDAAVKCAIESYATISGGIFDGTVTNNAGGEISDGTFKGDVENSGYIEKGTFNGEVTNNTSGTIFGGTFRGQVDNNGKITGGIFAAGLSTTPGTVTGGIFNGNTGLTGAHQVTVTNGSVSTVNDEGPRNADGTTGTAWDLYSYKDTTMTITADTDIYSLNGKLLGEGDHVNGNKNTVKFTMPEKDVALNGAIASGELVMEKGWPKASNEGTISCEGTDWSYDHSTKTLTLTSGTYDFSSTEPVACAIEIQWRVEITGGIFAGEVTNEGTIKNGIFEGRVTNNGTIMDNGTFNEEVTNSGYIKDGTFNGEVTNSNTIENGTFAGSVTNEGTIKNGSFEKKVTNGRTIMDGVFKGVVENGGNGTIFGGTFAGRVNNSYGGHIFGGVFNGHINVPGFGVYPITVDTASSKAEIKEVNGVSAVWEPYVVVTELTKNQKVIITASTKIYSLNHKPLSTDNCNSAHDGNENTVKFTMPNANVVLNGAITSTDLVMENGWPKDSSGGKTPCKGDGWEYIPNDPTNGNMLLLTGSNQTGGLFDFSTIGDGSAVECNVFVGKPTAITGGEFNGKVFNNSGILGGTFHGEVDNMGPGRIVNGTFKNSVENNGMIENGTFHDKVKNNGTIEKGTFEGTVENNTNGTISGGTFAGSVSNNGGTVNGGIFNGNTGLDGVTDLHSITWDAASSNAKIEKVNGVSADWAPYVVTSNATTKEVTITADTEIFSLNGQPIAESSYGVDKKTVTFTMPDDDVVLNGELITKPEPEPEPEPKPEPTPKPEPEPEPTTYTVTVIGGTIDGKTSVSAKENDTLTVVLDQSEIPDGMTFDMWSISSSKLSGDINVDYRAEAMTFQMPPEDVTIRAQYRSAEIIEDAAPSPLATAATIAVGGAAAGIVVWQGVNLGVDLYLANALPQGVPVPTDRRALALLLWETAGKPEVALPTLYGDIPAEEIELQKATRWAVQNGLMDAADKKDASFFDPDHYVTKMDVFGAWLRLKKLLGTT